MTAQADGYAVHSVETGFDNLPSRSARHPLSKEGFGLVPYPMRCLRRTTVGADDHIGPRTADGRPYTGLTEGQRIWSDTV